MTTKNLKFRPGIFLSIDDVSGGRKIVMVCKDGVTFWDAMNANEVTPIALHSALAPTEVGTFMEYIETKSAAVAAQALLTHMRLKMDSRVDGDALYVMRALWHAVNDLDAAVVGSMNWPDEAARFEKACQTADEEEARALRMHMHAEAFNKVEAA